MAKIRRVNFQRAIRYSLLPLTDRKMVLMATFHFDLVSPEKLAFSGEVDQVDVPGVEGDFGVLAGHAPVVAVIRPGILTVTTGGTHQKIIVLGGLAEVSDKGLTVLADVATSLAGTGSGQVRRHRLPRWKPSLPRKRAPSSTARSSGSIISRASSSQLNSTAMH